MDPFSHSADAGGSVGRQLGWVETASPVQNFNREGLVISADVDVDFVYPGIAGHVGQGHLNYPIACRIDIRGQFSIQSVMLEIDPDTALFGEFFEMPDQRR